MLLRRCEVLFFEVREKVSFDLDALLSGEAGAVRSRHWMALAPHLGSEVEVAAIERDLLGEVSPSDWTDRRSLSAYPPKVVRRLLHIGLLIGNGQRYAGNRRKDDLIRAGHWWPVAALMQQMSRWREVDSVAAMETSEMSTATALRDKLGPPPCTVDERVPPSQRLSMPKPDDGAFDRMLKSRTTCRNFDVARSLSSELLARMLQRVLMAQALVHLREDTVFQKKNVPSGGGLHAIEAYLIVHRVDGLEAGIYHYHSVDHALEPLPRSDIPLDALACRFLAGQHWFSASQVQVVLVARYARSFWKYRRHAKAYRALVLDAGHISHAFYTSATELGLGAFVTSAINEVDIEEALGLDPLEHGALAICGFGWRAEKMTTTEFDPAHQVWSDGDG